MIKTIFIILLTYKLTRSLNINNDESDFEDPSIIRKRFWHPSRFGKRMLNGKHNYYYLFFKNIICSVNEINCLKEFCSK